MKDEIMKAVKYAGSSNKLENNNLSPNELKQITETILAKKSDKSFLLSIVESLKENETQIGEEDKNVKTRKWFIKLFIKIFK